MVENEQNAEGEVRVAMVGKYTELLDAYKSLIEALRHAGIQAGCRVVLDFIDAEDIENQGPGLRPSP